MATWITAATDLDPSERYCTCCQRPLKGKVAMLELDQRINLYHDFGDVPGDKSQGWFPFGMTCAAKERSRSCHELVKTDPAWEKHWSGGYVRKMQAA